MNTYILLWNPKRWNWDTIEQDIEQADLTGRCSQRWSCGNIKSIQPGDRIFLLRLGTEPRGLVAAGFATSKPFVEKHWETQDRDAYYITLDFEIILNADKEPILTVEMLSLRKILQEQNWSPQSSLSVKPEVVDELEAVWSDFLTSQNIRHDRFFPVDNGSQKTFTEGQPNIVLLTKYERNQDAREACLKQYGYTCSICGFNFEDFYGPVGKELIHIHHLIKVADFKNEHDIDPINDLRPVCPNCHSVIHKRKIPYSIDEVKEFIKQRLL